MKTGNHAQTTLGGKKEFGRRKIIIVGVSDFCLSANVLLANFLIILIYQKKQILQISTNKTNITH